MLYMHKYRYLYLHLYLHPYPHTCILACIPTLCVYPWTLLHGVLDTTRGKVSIRAYIPTLYRHPCLFPSLHPHPLPEFLPTCLRPYLGILRTIPASPPASPPVPVISLTGLVMAGAVRPNLRNKYAQGLHWATITATRYTSWRHTFQLASVCLWLAI